MVSHFLSSTVGLPPGSKVSVSGVRGLPLGSKVGVSCVRGPSPGSKVGVSGVRGPPPPNLIVMAAQPNISLSAGSGLRPLIMFLHGGPHSAITNTFYSSVALFVSLGYSVALPNYRGSLGLGRSGIDSLPCHVGDLDVEDCHAAALECLERSERSNI